jgi:hypothetical protein
VRIMYTSNARGRNRRDKKRTCAAEPGRRLAEQ